MIKFYIVICIISCIILVIICINIYHHNKTALEIAFTQGASWWEWYKEGATMWNSDQRLADEEAKRRTENKSLGITMTERFKRIAKENNNAS